MTVYSLMTGMCGLVVGVENRNPMLMLKLDCYCSKSMNMVCTRLQMDTIDFIPPLYRYGSVSDLYEFLRLSLHVWLLVCVTGMNRMDCLKLGVYVDAMAQLQYY